MKKVVVVGGGNGSAVTINALKAYRDQVALSAVISMCDSGGSSGVLRREFGVLPPGDLLRAVLAMSPHDYSLLKDIFYTKRFAGRGSLDHHNLGNMFLTLATKHDGSMVNAFRALEDAVSAVGHVYPVTLEPSDLCVSLVDGTIVIGEHAIDRPTYDRSKKIVRAWLQPTPMIFAEAKRSIEQADVILLGPGTTYGSIIANLLVEGVVDALRASSARMYFILGNSFETIGETGPETVSAVVKTIQSFLPRPITKVIYNASPLITDTYKEATLKMFTDDTGTLDPQLVARVELGDAAGLIDPEKLGKLLMTLL